MGRVNLHRDPLRPLFQLLEGSGQRLAGTEQAGTGPVGFELPATGSDICNGPAATGVKMAMANSLMGFFAGNVGWRHGQGLFGGRWRGFCAQPATRAG